MIDRENPNAADFFVNDDKSVLSVWNGKEWIKYDLRVKDLTAEVAKRDEMLYDAWCLIANAGVAPLNWRIDGKLDHLGEEERDWVVAAERWRDEWQSNG